MATNRPTENAAHDAPFVSSAIRINANSGGASKIRESRSSRRVELSALGQAFLPHAAEAHAAVVAAYERGRRLAARDDQRLAVGYGAGAGAALVALMPEMQRRFPDLLVEPRAMTTATS